MEANTAATADRPAGVKNILDGLFRANPDYELVLFDRLSDEQKELFEALRADSDFYGILQPRPGCGLGVKSVCRDTALLFLTMQEIGELPFFVRDSKEDSNHAIARLVLDGVLTMRRGEAMVCGAAAQDILCEETEPQVETGLARMSIRALEYAERLPIQDAGALSARLYFYGRIPFSPAWQSKFPDQAAVERCLGIGPAYGFNPDLDRNWQRLPVDPANDGWIAWKSTRMKAHATRRSPGYKLYLSPRPDHIAEAFRALVVEAAAAGSDAFKVGKDAFGLLRPDKMVAYFATFEQVAMAAERLFERLKGCPPHGVSFTAQLASPLLSWGMDPPGDEHVPAWMARESWRLWVTNRLAVALIAGKSWKFALNRLRLEGVDTNSWTPARKGN
jgi:hypothetical protein